MNQLLAFQVQTVRMAHGSPHHMQLQDQQTPSHLLQTCRGSFDSNRLRYPLVHIVSGYRTCDDSSLLQGTVPSSDDAVQERQIHRC
jgi:hypothetical protein